jgi:hypothetical protein
MQKYYTVAELRHFRGTTALGSIQWLINKKSQGFDLTSGWDHAMHPRRAAQAAM